MDKFFVIKVVNTSQAELRKWYRKRSGEMFICTLNSEKTAYVTQNYIDDNLSVGIIEPQFCRLLTSFECEDDY